MATVFASTVAKSTYANLQYQGKRIFKYDEYKKAHPRFSGLAPGPVGAFIGMFTLVIPATSLKNRRRSSAAS